MKNNCKKNKKNKWKIRLGRIGRLSTIFLGGSYILSCFSCGIKTVNKTISCDMHSIIYDMDYLTSDMHSRDINDLRINQMSSINTLKIDMSNTDSLSFLCYYTDLKSIEISNAQELTNEDIEFINFSNIKEIYLFFDRETVLNKLDEGFDLDRFKNKLYIKNVDFIERESPKDGIIRDSKEINSIIFFEYLRNYKDCKLEFLKYSRLNDELNHIAEAIDANAYDNTIDKLFEIVDYITNRLEYDEEVSKSNNKDNKLSLKEKKKITDKVDNYNTNSLTSGIASNYSKVNSAICTNYSDALLALGIKEGLNIHSVKGECNGDGHAWNVINFGGYYYLIDLTNFDTLKKEMDLIREYRLDSTQENYEKLLHSLLITVNMESLSYYDSYYNLMDYVEPTLKENSESNLYGTNLNKYGVLVHNGLLSLGLYCLLCLGVVGIEIIKQKKKYQQSKGPIKKSLDRFSKMH